MRILQVRLVYLLSILIVAVLSIAAFSQASQPAPQSAPPPQGTSAPPQAQGPTYETATVLKAVTRLVVVDVVATNGKGEAITDLKNEDFTLLEDGKEQTIKAFSLQKPAAEPPQSAQDMAKLPDNIAANIPRYNVNNALNVILIDALNTTVPNQSYMRDEMIKYLARIPEGQPIAVYSLGRKLTLLQDFTSDPKLLKKVAQNLKAEASRLQENPVGGPETQLLPTGFVDSGLVPESLVRSLEQFVQQDTANMTDLRVTYTMEALRAIARALAGYPGRKNLIWISEVFPLEVNPTASVGLLSRNYSSDIARVADNLIDAQVAVYPIDAKALTGSSIFNPANPGTDQLGRATSVSGARLQNTFSTDRDAEMGAHSAMQEIAEKTGGRAFYNRNDLDNAIGSSIADGSTYYTLAYYPENKDWNGKFRKIQIKVKRSGVKMRYRLGYFAVDPRSLAKQDEKLRKTIFNESMNIDFPISTGLRFQAAILQPSEKTQNKIRVNFAIDPHALGYDIDAQGVRHASVECGAAIFNEKGEGKTFAVNTFMAELTPEIYARVMRSALPCQHSIDLPPGRYLLRLGVRDTQTGLIGTANARLTVAPASASAAPTVEEKKP